MKGTGSPAILRCEEHDDEVEDRPERLKHDEDPVIDHECMSEVEGRCAEPDQICLYADAGRALLSNQMDDLGQIANKAKRDPSEAQELRGEEKHGGACCARNPG